MYRYWPVALTDHVPGPDPVLPFRSKSRTITPRVDRVDRVDRVAPSAITLQGSTWRPAITFACLHAHLTGRVC